MGFKGWDAPFWKDVASRVMRSPYCRYNFSPSSHLPFGEKFALGLMGRDAVESSKSCAFFSSFSLLGGSTGLANTVFKGTLEYATKAAKK